MLRQIGHSYDFLSGKSRDYGQIIKGQKWSAIYFPFFVTFKHYNKQCYKHERHQKRDLHHRYYSKYNHRNLILICKYTQTFQIYKLSLQTLSIVDEYLGDLPSDFSRNSGHHIRTTPSEGVRKWQQLQQCEVTVSREAPYFSQQTEILTHRNTTRAFRPYTYLPKAHATPASN